MDVEVISGEAFIHKEVDEDKGLYQIRDGDGQIYPGTYGESLMKRSKIETITCMFGFALTDDDFAKSHRLSQSLNPKTQLQKRLTNLEQEL